MTIKVIGTPGPQGSKSFKGFSGGKSIMIESSALVKPWRESVVWSARAIGRRISGPVVVEMVFTVKKPKGAPKKRRTWPGTKPDLSKLARSTEDALVTAGAIDDDACIVEYLRLAKVYPGEDKDALDVPGAVIRIFSVTEGV